MVVLLWGGSQHKWVSCAVWLRFSILTKLEHFLFFPIFPHVPRTAGHTFPQGPVGRTAPFWGWKVLGRVVSYWVGPDMYSKHWPGFSKQIKHSKSLSKTSILSTTFSFWIKSQIHLAPEFFGFEPGQLHFETLKGWWGQPARSCLLEKRCWQTGGSLPTEELPCSRTCTTSNIIRLPWNDHSKDKKKCNQWRNDKFKPSNAAGQI